MRCTLTQTGLMLTIGLDLQESGGCILHFTTSNSTVHIYAEEVVSARPIDAVVVLFWLTIPSSRR